MRYATIDGSELSAIATIFSQNMKGSADGGSDVLKSASSAAATFARARVRQNLIAKLYPEGLSESFVMSAFYHSCCFSCAWAQEVNAVMVWASEGRGIQLYYGDWTECKCGQLTDRRGALVYTAEVAPQVGMMVRER